MIALSHRLACCVWLPIAIAGITPSVEAADPGARLSLQTCGSITTLALDGTVPIHTTAHQVLDPRVVEIPDSAGVAVTWGERTPDGAVLRFSTISLDGRTFTRTRETDYRLELRYAVFDPAAGTPYVPPALRAAPASELYIVQFVTQPLEAYRQALLGSGALVRKFLPNHAYVVKMSPAARAAVTQLPFVRWVGPLEPAYKLEEEILAQLRSGQPVEPRRYSIMLYERGATAQDRVGREIVALGGEVHGTTPEGFRLEATLTLEQVRAIAALDDVMFIDRKGQLEVDMDIVRQIGGANFIESTLGFTGQGVRAEVADTELYVTHTEWATPPIIHIAGDAGIDHGTSVYGILFARGAAPQARGLLPGGVGIFAESSSLLGGGPTRYQRTAEIVDPNGPYQCVFQTNSTGDPRTTQYTTISAEMDDILFLYDILICQSQSNAGTQDSRPQAWAKNIVSVGGVYHYDTLSRSDDAWDYGGSIGPASDGRIKPTLTHFYDDIYTTTTGGGYTQFGGTSGATPIVAGHFGLMFQMWHEGVFPGFGGGATVFASRPHMTTAKALLVNTAYRYNWQAGGPNADITRYKQGWGMPDLQELYNQREKILIVDESEVLTPLDSALYTVTVAPGEPNFRATLVYADPHGNVGAAHHRINDLSMRVISPGGTMYWGNNGLTASNFSTPGGSSDTLDTEENVFVADPEAGLWSVEVLADEINEDSHTETPQVDADFALVVTGGATSPPPFTMRMLRGPTGLVPPGSTPTVQVEITPGTEAIVPGSETMFRRTDGGAFVSEPLIHETGNTYSAQLPFTYCGTTPQYYFSAQGDQGTIRTLPSNAPAGVFAFQVGGIGVFYQNNLNSSPGWTAEAMWGFGQPLGGGGQHGGHDPTSGHTGIYVYGYNLGGDYENNLTAERKLTSGPIDCTGKTRVQLSFWRWLGVEQSTHDHAAVRISTNGSTWTTLWQNTAQVADTSWQQMTFDISAIADNQPTVYLRWAMGPTDGLNQYCGWNIDDLALTGLSCESVLLPGDMNCDGLLNTADIAPFVLALCDPAAYAAEYPTCNILSGEFTDDELVDGRDIQGFVDVLLGP